MMQKVIRQGIRYGQAHAFSSQPSRDAIQRCLANYSVEVTPMAAKKIDSFARVNGLAPGTTVNVTFLVGSDIDDTIGICKRLQDGGMQAVAHVPARAFDSLKDVEHYFDRLRDVGVGEVLVLGGGADKPAGELHEAFQILESGLPQKYSFSRVGVAAHPEGHPDVAKAVMEDALLRKAEWASANGVDLYYETQFCFEPEPIIDWEKHVRGLLTKRLGSSATPPPVHIGVAGPAKIANLIKFATMSGVGPSIRFVKKYTGNVFKLATTSAPDELIAGLAAYQAKEPACLVRTLHFYPFGGLAPTLKWANAAKAGSFQQTSSGFDVTA